MTGTHSSFTLAIIGGGPNCLYIIERLYAHIQALGQPPVRIRLEAFDSEGHFGSGCHYPAQPATNHLNRAADQISFGADDTNLDEVSFILDESERWTLYSWCQNEYCATREERFNIGPPDWVERRLFGEVSEQVFAIYIAQLRRRGVEVTLHVSSVQDIEATTNNRYRIYGWNANTQYTVEADFVVLCTGHGETTIQEGTLESRLASHAQSNANTSYIHNIYPLERISVSSVPPGCTATCRGMGLAAIDFILWVTEARGGRFVAKPGEGDRLMYFASGLEPKKIIPFSDSGIFILTRAYNQKMNDQLLLHRGIYFTVENIDRLRSVVGVPQYIPNVGVVPQLDFEAHLLPLIRLEMALLYYRVLFGSRFGARIIRASLGRVIRFTQEAGVWHDSQEAGSAFLSLEVDAAARDISARLPLSCMAGGLKRWTSPNCAKQ